MEIVDKVQHILIAIKLSRDFQPVIASVARQSPYSLDCRATLAMTDLKIWSFVPILTALDTIPTLRTIAKA